MMLIKLKAKHPIRISVKNACVESTINIIFFRSYLSVNTPAIGAIINVGNMKKKFASDNIKRLPVSRVIHTIMTNWTIKEPNIENNWPDQKNK